MAQSLQTPVKQKPLPQTGEKETIENLEEDSLSQHYFIEDQQESDEISLQKMYLERLRQQRKRIEQLSELYTTSRYNYEQQASKNKLLQDEISKLQNLKQNESKYHQIQEQFHIVIQEKEKFQEMVDQLNHSIYSMTNQNNAKLQKMANDFNNSRKKDNAKIRTLEQSLEEKEQEIERLEKQLKNKEKEIAETNHLFNSKMSKLKDEYQQKITIQHKRIERIQTESKLRGPNFEQLQTNLKFFARENEKLREQNFQLKRNQQQRQSQLLDHIQKCKSKVNFYKRQIKNKEKQYDSMRNSCLKIQKEKKDHIVLTQQHRTQITTITSQLTTKMQRQENDFNVQRRNMKILIEQHVQTINDYIKIKQELLDRIRQLESIIKKKQFHDKQRKSLLRNEMKEIDKLEKVIDKIVQ